MSTYVVGFITSIFLIYYAEAKKFRGREAKVAVFFSILIPCMIAGLRAASIGTDIQVYAEPIFITAQNSESFFEYWGSEFYMPRAWAYSFVNEYEIGYVILNYIVAKGLNSFPCFLFLLQLLTVYPIFKCLMDFRNTQPVWLGMIVYYLMFYNQTLNSMRQWVAMAFLFYGFQYLRKDSYPKYICCIFGAFLFHKSAILGLIIFAVYVLITKKSRLKKTVKAFILVCLGVIGIFSLDIIVIILRFLGLPYESYISGELHLMPYQFLYRIPIMLLFFVRWKYIKIYNQNTLFYLVMLFYDVLASQLNSIIGTAGRIGLYFSEYYMLTYPAICSASTSKKNRQVMRLFVLSYLCVYWWYTFVFSGWSQTVPYVSVFG